MARQVSVFWLAQLSLNDLLQSFYVPKDPTDVTLLAKTIAVSTERLMTVVDPTK